MLDKKSLRHTIRERKKQHSAEALQQLSDAITQRLLRHPLLQRAQTVMLYYSLPDEVNTHALVNQLVSDDKTVLLPRVTGESTMELRRYASENDLELGAFNIMEPVGELFTDLERIDLAIIPGMAFDQNGNRLGRGKGFYDRFLRDMTATHKIGLCFPFQFVDEVPIEPTDVGVDEVVYHA